MQKLAIGNPPGVHSGGPSQGLIGAATRDKSERSFKIVFGSALSTIGFCIKAIVLDFSKNVSWYPHQKTIQDHSEIILKQKSRPKNMQNLQNCKIQS